ncbi:hypothetical protein [Paenibacillus sp. NEAU-GSW1]|uniref:hypothetical protein n=1 Tax=Paenibacillus sp. NEAU-GSW1 TaxID=2682486 RepID=UPI0012E2BB49|nr:hypothetical protein [Paenibacillus sp. NEAU-GSW1]MUT67136.1 hypothetical protein [Paenibacillus sp. NEAU-GSW1]
MLLLLIVGLAGISLYFLLRPVKAEEAVEQTAVSAELQVVLMPVQSSIRYERERVDAQQPLVVGE